jgi:hypothetical protein
MRKETLEKILKYLTPSQRKEIKQQQKELSEEAFTAWIEESLDGMAVGAVLYTNAKHM